MKVLVVEDHEDSARLLARFLGLAGHEAGLVFTRAEALDACRGERFDLLLCDLTLPDGDGIDIPALLPSRCAGVPAIALTGWARDEDAERCRAAGFAAFLAKPVSLDDLLAAVQAVGGGMSSATASPCLA